MKRGKIRTNRRIDHLGPIINSDGKIYVQIYHEIQNAIKFYCQINQTLTEKKK